MLYFFKPLYMEGQIENQAKLLLRSLSGPGFFPLLRDRNSRTHNWLNNIRSTGLGWGWDKAPDLIKILFSIKSLLTLSVTLVYLGGTQPD
jgi:hypothetical protein